MSSTPHVVAASSPTILPTPATGKRDFDFLFGHWRVANRRLRERLAGSSAWDEFEASTECRPLLGGLGNLETWESGWSGGLRGIALRLFDPAAQRWSIRWASDRTGTLEPAVVGGFEDGVGSFFGPDEQHGVAVLARYRWSQIVGDPAHADSAVWDQAWSTDEGRSWETNWVMHFTRRAA
jgi:hypothetical protein